MRAAGVCLCHRITSLAMDVAQALTPVSHLPVLFAYEENRGRVTTD
jgi:hypothetical protein